MRAKPGAIGAIVRAYGVPEGWQMKLIGDLAKVVGGATPSRDENRFWSGGTIAWASPTDLTQQQAKYIEHTADYITEAGFKSCSTSLLPVGAVLYTSRATIGAKAIAAVPITTNQGFANFITNEEITSEFLYYYLDILTPVFIRLGAGTTFLEVSKRDIRKVQCAIPHTDEQAIIANILNAVDEAIKRTRTTLEKARRLKEGILQKAFSRDHAHVEKLKGFVTDIRYGTSQASNDKRWGYPTLRIPNIIGGTINDSDLTYVDATATDAKRYLLKEDDILLVRTNGNPAYIGRSAVFSPPDEKEWLYASYLIRMRFNDNLYARYIDEYLKSERGRRELMKRVTTSAGNYNINTKSILTIPFPYQDETAQAETIALTDAANVQISRFENELTALEKLKRGLMQDLLTGKVRVKQLATAEIAGD